MTEVASVEGQLSAADDLAVEEVPGEEPMEERSPLMRRRTDREQRELTQRIEENLPLVSHIVFQVAVHFPRHVDRDELARAGALGLVEAARRFDETKGVPFERFAAQRIRGAIIDAVRAADWAPRSVRALARRLDSTEQELASRLGRVPSMSEMADALEMTKAELNRLQDRLFRSVVLAFEHLVADSTEEELTLIDVLADQRVLEPASELEQRELHSYLRDAITLLPERQRLVIVGYFLQEKTSQELARFLGVTESRVSQMRTEALESLKGAIEAQYEPTGSGQAPTGRRDKRQANYANRVGERQDLHSRISDAGGLEDERLVDALLSA
jgi:RNA polymerase sigma factor for flagellar operon FliA